MNVLNIVLMDQTAIRKLLLCNVCNKPLNVPPIIYNETLGYTCGRCNTEMSSSIRQSLYEELIKFITFPCANEKNGCDTMLKHDEVILHEATCKRIDCPLSSKLWNENICSWTGTSESLKSHVKTHEDCFLDQPLELSLNIKNRIFFTYVDIYVMTVAIKKETAKKYNVLISMIGTEIESQCFRYQVELLNIDKNISLQKNKDRVYSLMDFLENLNKPEIQLELDYEKLLEALEKPRHLLMKFNIAKKSRKEIVEIIGNNDSELLKGKEKLEKENTPVPDNHLLMELECPVCGEYMLPPIFSCAAGHSICNDCRPQISKCPNCRMKMTDGRCFTLDNLTSKVNFPCKNRETGCEFVGNGDTMRAHHSQCQSFLFNCVLGCRWNGALVDYLDHLTYVHKHSLLDHDAFYSTKFSEPSILFLWVHNELFCVILKQIVMTNLKPIERGFLDVSVKHIHIRKSRQSSFKCNIVFIKTLSSSKTLLFDIPCSSILYKGLNIIEDVEKINGEFRRIPCYLLKPYKNGDTYYYKIVIKEM